MDRTIQVLTVAEIVLINRRMIDRFGGIFIEGNHNLASPEALEHVLLESQGSLFGQELYPRIIDKAALICWRIIQGHVLHDGNKRTGLEVCRQILEINGYTLHMKQELVEIMLRIARGEMSLSEYTEWLDQYLTS